LHPAEIDDEQCNRDTQDFDDENERAALREPDGVQKYFLDVGVEGKEPSVPLVIECFPGKTNVSE
jgi:hypothetical protein